MSGSFSPVQMPSIKVDVAIPVHVLISITIIKMKYFLGWIIKETKILNMFRALKYDAKVQIIHMWVDIIVSGIIAFIF